MMRYAVVINYNEQKDICLVAVVENGNYRNVIGVYQVAQKQLASWCKSNNLQPFNFSIGSDFSVKQDAGMFNRFEKAYGVVLARVFTYRMKLLGFRIINKSGAVQDVTLNDIVKNGVVLQNAILRQGAIQCYTGYPFDEIVMPKPAKPISQPSSTASEFTDAQLKEINTARKQGVTTQGLIENPQLSPNQMRVLWVSKRNGSLSEMFAKPCYSVPVMKFYADRIYNDKSVSLCKQLLAHPELDVEELEELYLCILTGVNINSLIGKSASDIRFERNKKCKVIKSKSDLVDNALRVANKIRNESKS